MARLLLLAALFAGSLATYSGSSSYGGGGYGGGGWDSSNKKQEKGGNDKVIEIDIHVISWGHGGSAPTQDVAAPKMPPGQTHTVFGWSPFHVIIQRLIKASPVGCGWRHRWKKSLYTGDDRGRNRRRCAIQLYVKESYSYSVNIPSTLRQIGRWEGLGFPA